MDTEAAAPPAESPGTAAPLSFEAVYQDRFPDVTRWCRALGGPAMDMEDLAQEVFLVVHRRLPEFDGRNLGAWLYAITAYTVAHYRRRTWFKHFVARHANGHRDGSAGGEPREVLERVPDRQEGGVADPAAALERRDRRRLLSTLLGRLSEEHRAALLLFEVEGCSGEQIAALQGIPMATVRTRLYHARRILAREAGRLQRPGRES